MVLSKFMRFYVGDVTSGGGGSLQDVRDRDNGEVSTQRKTSSACNLRRPSLCGQFCY